MKKTLLLPFLLILVNTFCVDAQSNKLGVMPIRIKFTKHKPMKMGTLPYINNPSTMSGESIDIYEEKYMDMIDEVILQELGKAKFDIEELDLSELSKEDRSKEEEFFKLIRTDQWLGYLGDKDIWFFQNKNKKKTKQSSAKAGPLANIFADHLDRDYLLYTVIIGNHRRTKNADKKNKAYPKNPFGDIEIYGFLVDGNNGMIVEDVFVSYNDNLLGTYQSRNQTLFDNRVKNLAKMYVKKWKSKVKRFHKKKSK